KTAAIFILATRPSLGIMGAALAIVIGMMLVTLLHFSTIVKAISYSFYIKDYLKSGVTMVLSGICGHYFYQLFFVDQSLGVRTLAAIGVTSVIYVIFLFLFKLLTKEEVRRIPIIGPKLASLL